MSLLELKGVETFYGASQALFGVTLDVREGEVVALMGRNGMGKTTTINSIFGLARPCSGTVSFAGRQIAGMRPHRIARLGLGLVPEGRRCFPNLTVLENLLAAARGSEWTLQKVVDLFPRLGERRDQYANSLSGGEQQMLAIGLALMTNPRRGNGGSGAGDPSGHMGGDAQIEGERTVDPGSGQDAVRAIASRRPLFRTGKGSDGLPRFACGADARTAGPLPRRLNDRHLDLPDLAPLQASLDLQLHPRRVLL